MITKDDFLKLFFYMPLTSINRTHVGNVVEGPLFAEPSLINNDKVE